METLAGPHPLTYRRLRLDLLGAVFFCRKLMMLITIANVPFTHAQMLQMASNLFTVSPPFIVYIISRYSDSVNRFPKDFQKCFEGQHESVLALFV